MHTDHGPRSSVTGRDQHCYDHGFCTICGSVWPCARADRDIPTMVPVARLDTAAWLGRP